MSAELMLWLIPWIRTRCSSATNWGMIAFTAGLWTPLPIERMTETARIAQIDSQPKEKIRAKTRVATAMKLSLSMIRILRL